MSSVRPWIIAGLWLATAGLAVANTPTADTTTTGLPVVDAATTMVAPVAAEPDGIAADNAPVLADSSASSAAAGEPDPVIDLFVSKCASCHTVGKGERVGPDLKGVTDRRDRAWLTSMIQSPSRVLDSDPEARALLQKYNGVRMPDLGLTAAQAGALVDLVARCSVEPCELVGKFTPVTEATPDQVALGEALFTGNERLGGGALPCISCHTVDTIGGVPGGTLAKNLTHAFARLGDEGLDAALKNPSFNLMNKVYSDRPLEASEAFALRAFLHEANRSQGAGGDVWSVLLVAVLISIAAMAVLNGFWRRRLMGVRSTVTRKGIAQ